MKKHRKAKNIVYIALLAVFLIVVGFQIIQNISLIQKISQNAGIEDVSIGSNILIFQSGGGGGGTSTDSTSSSSSSSGGVCTCCTMVCNRVCTPSGFCACSWVRTCSPCACACHPNCASRTCGGDGCGGSCGTCGTGYVCSGGTCALTCTPNCAGKTCGDDGCGGSCGTCGTGYTCVPTGQCSQYPGCNGYALDGYCSGAENQTGCPGDCKTNVTMTPNANLIVGQPVQIIIFFSDGRYLANHNVSFALSIDGTVWDSSNGCQYGGVILSHDGVAGTTQWPVNTTPVSDAFTFSDNGDFLTSFTCLIPPGLGLGQHILSATPTIYSQSLTLRAVQVQFNVGKQQDFNSYINSFIDAVKSFLGIK